MADPVGNVGRRQRLRYGMILEGSSDQDEIQATDAEERLIATLRREVDRYKNQIVALEKQLAAAK